MNEMKLRIHVLKRYVVGYPVEEASVVITMKGESLARSSFHARALKILYG